MILAVDVPGGAVGFPAAPPVRLAGVVGGRGAVTTGSCRVRGRGAPSRSEGMPREDAPARGARWRRGPWAIGARGEPGDFSTPSRVSSIGERPRGVRRWSRRWPV